MTYKIGKSGKACSSCATTFSPETSFHSALFEEEADWRREDFCTDCWGVGREGVFSHWLARIPPSVQKKPTFDQDRVLTLFAQVSDEESPTRARLRYLLALMLVRKRVFKFVGSATNGIRVLHVASDEEHLVEDPGLTAAEIEGARDELGRLLDLDL